MARERLDESDALALYRTSDMLALGWLANHVRERMHGNVAYFNVNRHINHTNVCVAACRLCAFGRKKGTRGRLHDGAGGGLRIGGVWLHRGGDGVPHRRRTASRIFRCNIFWICCAG